MWRLWNWLFNCQYIMVMRHGDFVVRRLRKTKEGRIWFWLNTGYGARFLDEVADDYWYPLTFDREVSYTGHPALREVMKEAKYLCALLDKALSPPEKAAPASYDRISVSAQVPVGKCRATDDPNIYITNY